MTSEGNAALSREIAEAGGRIVRLVRYDPHWADGLEADLNAFLRSFFAPLLALPFYLVVAGMIGKGSAGQVSEARVLWVAGLAHLVNLAAYPIVVAAAARALRLKEGYAAFIIVTNWASLFLNVALAAASLLAGLGTVGFRVFGFLALVLFGLSVFITWRAARETLAPELAATVLMVVLSVAVGALSDQLAALVVRVFS